MGLNERQKAMVIAGLDAGMSGKEVCNFVAQLSYESNQLNKLDESFIYRSDKAVNNIVNKVPSVLREGRKALSICNKKAKNCQVIMPDCSIYGKI